ncbi:MAG: hypothetical protein ACR2PL_25300 [Dehalococcoidia bacterium]
MDATDWRSVLEAPSTTPVFPQRVRAEGPAWSGHDRKLSRARVAPWEPVWQTVAAVAAGLDRTAWQARTVAEGAQGPRVHQFATLRVWERREEVPGREWRRQSSSVGFPIQAWGASQAPFTRKRGVADPNTPFNLRQTF